MGEFPTGKFRCILMDPPWAFLTFGNDRTTPHSGQDRHYDVMAEGDLQALPVAAIADEDCALFMWIVDAHLEEALRLAEGWGFAFKTIAFVWAKADNDGGFRIGMGYWTRKQTEICLMFTKGKPRRLGRGVRQLIVAPRREHSRKPDEQYRRIQQLVGGPYVELFARQPWPPFEAWGNETEKFEDPNIYMFGPEEMEGRAR